MEDIDKIVEAYISRRVEAEMLMAQVKTFFEKNNRLYPENQLPIVHSIKARTKDPEHLREKVLRKNEEEPDNPITIDNLFNRVTDLAGVRILHLYNDQFKLIHNEIMGNVHSGQWVLSEDPVANTWDPETKNYYEKLGLKTEVRETYYTSIHYVIKPNHYPNCMCCEIQVRTLFEEIWGEISHAINYPKATESVACREQLRVLAKLASTGSRLADSIFRSYGEYTSENKTR